MVLNIPELSFLSAPNRGWTRAGERRVQDNLHALAQNAAIFFPQIGGKTIFGSIFQIRTVIFHTEEGLYTRNVCVYRQYWHFSIIISWIINLVKILSCVIIFSRYIKLFDVCHPPVAIVMNKILRCMIIFSRYIKLFEVCYLPVVMIKILSCMIISFRLHQTIWDVPPASCDEQNIKLRDYFFTVTSDCLVCLRCATPELWWTNS